MRKFIVIDKCFIQASSRQEMLTLSQSKNLVMPAALFYELMTTLPVHRRECFRKLPAGQNPVVLVDHMKILLDHEVATQTAAGRPSNHCINFLFQFNPGLIEDEYNFPPQAVSALSDMAAEIEGDIDRLVDFSETMGQLFPGLIGGKNFGDLGRRRNDAFLSIANEAWILDFYRQARENSGAQHPCPEIVGKISPWAHIRWLQVNLMFALDLHIRYGGRLRNDMTPKIRIKLEHDIHDAQLLAYGVLEGDLATHEKKLNRWFQMLVEGTKE